MSPKARRRIRLVVGVVLLDDALSITLVQPSDGEAMSTSAAHAEGLKEMARLYKRKE